MAPATLAKVFNHGLWDQLLRQHVVSLHDGQATQVDYQGMNNDRAQLKAYLNQLTSISRQEFSQWSQQEQLAYLINLYNAWTIEFVLTSYPDIESIRELGGLFQSAWEIEIISLFGEPHSLNDIEHGLIRASGRFNDPRIHFAVNCASIGCPALRSEAYTGIQLEKQLEEQTEKFLSDRSRNRLKENTLEVSSIFKWYREDFEKGWHGVNSLTDFFAVYQNALGLTVSDVQRLHAGVINIEFLDYDWRLNARQK